jgi:hypothetical protein
MVLHIVCGIYHWGPKRIAFRNDFCLSCGIPRRAVQLRTFDAVHIYWIPILPLGFWKHWKCTVCGRDPHVSKKTRRGFKWVGLAILILFSAVSWAMPVTPDFVAGTWIFRIAAPVAAVLTLVHLLRTRKEPSLKEKLAGIVPATDTVCPFCGMQLLMLGSQSSCPACGILRC